MSLSVDKLITRLEYRLGWPDDANHRAKCLDFLNDSERYIATKGSWMYLRQRQPLSLGNTLSAVAAPTSPAMDPGKQAVISDDVGKLDYLPPDDFPGAPISDFYAVRTTRPAAWTMALVSAVMTIVFDRANTTGSPIAYTIDFQRAVVDLTDAGGSFSLLPDGYEISLLLEDAEARAMQYLRRLGWEKKRQWVDDFIRNEFFAAERTSKEETMPDIDTVTRASIGMVDNPE